MSAKLCSGMGSWSLQDRAELVIPGQGETLGDFSKIKEPKIENLVLIFIGEKHLLQI